MKPTLLALAALLGIAIGTAAVAPASAATKTGPWSTENNSGGGSA
jgi:hypothetical protein